MNQEKQPPYMNETFHRDVQEILKKKGHSETAMMLNKMGVAFEHAYELIFNRKPTCSSI